MHRMLIVAVASIIVASRASAADLPVPAGPAPAYIPVTAPYDWGGGYIGINGGYGFGQSQWSDPLNPSGATSTGDFHLSGALVGVTVGVSGQFGAFVLGVEGDFDWQRVSGTSGSTFCASIISSTAVAATAAGLNCKTESDWLGTIRARFGYAWDRVLLYGTAGGAGANVQAGLSGLPRQGRDQFGWTAGAGLEVAIADNWTVKVEYLFVDLAKASCNQNCGYDVAATATPTPAKIANTGVNFNENIIRAGLNFKFGH
jgi:outer membrane immunogenic protein